MSEIWIRGDSGRGELGPMTITMGMSVGVILLSIFMIGKIRKDSAKEQRASGKIPGKTYHKILIKK